MKQILKLHGITIIIVVSLIGFAFLMKSLAVGNFNLRLDLSLENILMLVILYLLCLGWTYITIKIYE